ncbi:CopD family protein [Sphingomonas sp. CD22]|jgi:putative membrane protein|uniref:CopD family protein n=1 Tax=Sphingomonas sp. CD22 TaxID=3100214 RepID=UPI002AE04E95|nr:CopD family protein [Sphingomonas sp. CD22]MEA1083464.1 CopD family protein [Sphingomonas sp. CD22]
MDMLAGAYLWIVAAHVIFVIFWMAGLFMLPRYLVYHQEALVAGRADEAALWVERESKLRAIILTPAMIVVWVLGLTLATVGHHWAEGWLHAKLLFVLVLSGYHGWAVGYAKTLARGVMKLDGRRLRMINEVPALAAVVIVVLVFVKPF